MPSYIIFVFVFFMSVMPSIFVSYASLRLMLVQSEMKLFGIPDTVALKQHFGKKIMELEDEKRTVQVNL